MTQNLITPILALELQGIWFIIVIAIAIISWLTNLASQKNPPKPPAARPPRKPGSDKLSQEIDVFLQEVSGRRKPSNPDRIEIEVIPDDEVRKRRTEQRPARPVQRPQQRPVQPQRPKLVQQQTASTFKPAAATTQTRVRPGQELAERHKIDPSQLGSDLQSHLSTYMGADRIEKEVKQHLKHEVDQGVSQHLGQFRASTTADAPTASSSTPSSQKAIDLVRLLRDPAGVRHAILINEVLGKPIALRPR